MNPKTICVFISGGGSNLAALIAAIVRGEIAAAINTVIADRDCAGLSHAKQFGVPFAIVPRRPPAEVDTFAAELLAAVPPETDLIVLAGFLSVIPDALIRAFPKKIINLHPSLLPEFGGMGMFGARVHQAVLDAGKTESGCTVHYVSSIVDDGEIIAQSRVPVLEGDSAASLQKRVQNAEHVLLPQTVATLLSPFQPSANLRALRAQIDALDQDIARLLCIRLQCIHQAAAEKAQVSEIRLPERIEDILQKVLPVADAHNIDRDYLDLLFRLLIDESIRREARRWHEAQEKK